MGFNASMLSARVCICEDSLFVFPRKLNTWATQEKITWKETFCSLLILLLYNEVAVSTGNKDSEMKVNLKLNISLPNFM